MMGLHFHVPSRYTTKRRLLLTSALASRSQYISFLFPSSFVNFQQHRTHTAVSNMAGIKRTAEHEPPLAKGRSRKVYHSSSNLPPGDTLTSHRKLDPRIQ